MSFSKTAVLLAVYMSVRKKLIKLSSYLLSFVVIFSINNVAVAVVSYNSLSDITGADFTDGTKWSTAACGGAAIGGIIAMTTIDSVRLCGNNISLTANDLFVPRLLSAYSGTVTFSGVLKYSAGNKLIYNGVSPTFTIPTLDVSHMANNNTIQMSPANGGRLVAFNNVTGGNLSCGGSSYIAGTGLAVSVICTVSGIPTPLPVAAPIGFSLGKKPVVYSKEVQK